MIDPPRKTRIERMPKVDVDPWAKELLDWLYLSAKSAFSAVKTSLLAWVCFNSGSQDWEIDPPRIMRMKRMR